MFVHPEKQLGRLFEPEAGKAGSFEVKLLPFAAVSGRILDADDLPVANAPLKLMVSTQGFVWSDSDFHKKVQTDAEGKFMIENLVEGVAYQMRWPLPGVKRAEGFRHFTVKAGEKKDLGKIKHKSEGNEEQ